MIFVNGKEIIKDLTSLANIRALEIELDNKMEYNGIRIMKLSVNLHVKS
jgi:hypothetical protein